jgi:phenylalanyl-tRNA synthetase beta chain
VLISRAWLQQLLGGDALPSDGELAELLTGLGLEVESVTPVGVGLEAIVVGRVESVEPHPDAKKLRLVRLFDGHEVTPVICGAPNVPAAGGKVAFAPVGTVLPDGLQIAAREIRGVPSHGMICSEVELDIGPDHDGILVLPDDWAPGDRLCDRVDGIIDTVFELGVTPNRPDALGHVGVARDLCVKLGRTLVLPRAEPSAASPDATLVTLRNPQVCARYLGHAYAEAKIGPSPLWLRVRLHRVGLRAINNVVDITNLVLMEWGQPLHAFDRERLAQGRVVVRNAHAGESITTLDEQTHELSADDLVIADAERPQALAGVMGGADAGVEGHTTQLLLEAAWFSPTHIRRTARRHQMASDSSHRFERGVDHARGLTLANDRARALIEEITGARCVGGCEVTGEPPSIPTIELRLSRARMLLGMEVAPDEARRILRGLEVQVDDGDPERWRCRPPTHRPDLQREVDLVEELMRHHGLDDLPLPAGFESRLADDVAHIDAERSLDSQNAVMDALLHAGLHEQLSFVFTREEALRPFESEVPLSRAVRLANPMRVQASVMRTHMLPGLLDALAVNVARHARRVRLFEVGRTYRWGAREGLEGPTARIDAQLPLETRRAAIVLSDGGHPEPGEVPVDGRDVAGLLLATLRRLGLRGRLGPVTPDTRASYLHPGVQALVEVEHGGETRIVGRFGEVHPDVMGLWELDEVRCVYAELWIDVLPRVGSARYEELPRFPSTSRDLSLEIPVDLPAATVVAALREAAGRLERSADAADDPPGLAPGERGHEAIEVREDYRGEGVPDGFRALLLRLHYRARERSVTDAEVQALHADIVERACETLRPRAPAIRAR